MNSGVFDQSGFVEDGVTALRTRPLPRVKVSVQVADLGEALATLNIGKASHLCELTYEIPDHIF